MLPGRAGESPGANPSPRPVSLYPEPLTARPEGEPQPGNTPYPSRRRAALLFHRRRRFIPGMVSRHHHR
ncbi:putative traB [Escherichia coli 178850]|nr:putative traB [Escherichia coli 178850]